MKLREIIELLSVELVYEPEEKNTENIVYAVAADLMSDIMLDTRDGSVLITGLMNQQVIRTAEMVNSHTIIFVRGKEIPPGVIELAKDKKITVLRSDCTMFETCGKLYQAGLIGGQ